ncbi:MAG: hypothetical protein MUC97_07050 [Bernardetiaceae bacterium]|jgi:hypothetical protein|nr:hypothetical protein [Bernardetiaceae bacterium]
MTAQDLLVGPVVLLLLLWIIKNRRRAWAPGPLGKYFMPALWAKLGGALLMGLVYTYYYGGGDTLLYFDLAGDIYRCFYQHSPLDGARILLGLVQDYEPGTYDYLAYNSFWVKKDFKTFFIIRLVALASVFTFHTYLANAFIFAAFSFVGNWAMYRVFVHLFPALARQFAIAVLFLPSVVFWGSGLMKDSITFGALGLLFYAFYFGAIRRQKLVRNAALGLFAAFLLYSIKPYILLCFIPSLAFWLYLGYTSQIRSAAARVLVGPFILTIALAGGYYGITFLSEGTEFDVGNLSAKAQVNATYLNRITDEQGSAYELPEFDGTLTGLLKNLPMSVSVTLFRPFLWEARNPVALFAGLEASLFIWLTGLVLWKVRWAKILASFRRYHLLPMCLLFSVSFAFSVGVTSGNFGTLVRYKIPMMPFYVAMLMVVLETNKKRRKVKFVV